MKLSHLPLRATTGAFVLNSGLNKRDLEGQAAEAIHGMAAGAIPKVKEIPPARFAKMLSNTEVALGSALLIPSVPSALVGLGLAGFGAGLVRLYWKTPGMHQPRDPRPTQEGLGLAKDVWLLGAGLTLMLDDLLLHRRHLRPRGMGAGRMSRRMSRKMQRGMGMGRGMGRSMMMPGKGMMRGLNMGLGMGRGVGMMRGLRRRANARTGMWSYLPMMNGRGRSRSGMFMKR